MEKDYFDLYGNRQEILQTILPKGTAKSILLRGLQYYLGQSAQWISDYDVIAEWLENNHNKGLLLSGSNGVGKTVICTKILPIVFKYYMKIHSPLELICNVKATDIEARYDKELSMRYSKILIIDDMGAESTSTHFGTRRDFVSELVDSCEADRRLLITTTNLTPDEIGERYGVRTLDRLRSITHSFTIAHDSMRK